MLAELMKQRWLDAVDTHIKATRMLINSLSDDKSIKLLARQWSDCTPYLMRKNENYAQLSKELQEYLLYH